MLNVSHAASAADSVRGGEVEQITHLAFFPSDCCIDRKTSIYSHWKVFFLWVSHVFHFLIVGLQRSLYQDLSEVSQNYFRLS